jgi:uncharacterized caspase-like protein
MSSLKRRAGTIFFLISFFLWSMNASHANDDFLKPKLYAVVIGISAYQSPDLRLTFPAKDANDFAAALENQKGGLYSDVTVKLLVDKDATSSAVRDGLDWLTKQVTSRDVGLVYVNGQGIFDERDRFYFLAVDGDPARLRATGVPREDIVDALDALSGKALLFLDARHSAAIGAPDMRRGNIPMGEHGVVAFFASTGKKVSQENADWDNGAFTKAIVEGLGHPGVKSKADYNGDGKITISELDTYISERVKTLTGGTQTPIMIRPPTVPDFPIAVAR